MELKLVTADELRRILTPAAAVEVMDRAMRAVSAGEIDVPARMFCPVAGSADDLFGLMPGSSAGLDVYGAKIISLHPENGARGLPSIQGFVCLFDRQDGRPLALIEGASLTAVRTAAASALATRELARADAASHGVFGTGVQAASHIDAIAAVRPIERIVIWGRSIAAAEQLAESAGTHGVEVVATDDPAMAAACDVVSTVTASSEPVLEGRWVRPGTHVNLVGAHQPDAREADTALVSCAKVYVDLVASALTEAGDLLVPLSEGAIDRDHIVGEIGNLLSGSVPGRTSNDDITVYKSLGVVAQDLYAADYVLKSTSKAASEAPPQ